MARKPRLQGDPAVRGRFRVDGDQGVVELEVGMLIHVDVCSTLPFFVLPIIAVFYEEVWWGLAIGLPGTIWEYLRQRRDVPRARTAILSALGSEAEGNRSRP